MLKTLFQRRVTPAPADTARVPDGRRVYAIGDVHGCLGLLTDLLARIDADDAARGGLPDGRQAEIIFLGDLVDRGPDSAGVIEAAIRLQRERGDVRFLAGNHEEVFLSAATGDEKATRFFIRIGGRETILSYDIALEEYMALDTAALAERLPALIPREHIDFVRGFEDRIVIGDYAFVHAGVRPGVRLEDQSPKDVRWIREEFLSAREPHEKVVIYGHTIDDEVVEKGNRIGIDTGAYQSGRLTAIGLEGGDRWFLDTAE